MFIKLKDIDGKSPGGSPAIDLFFDMNTSRLLNFKGKSRENSTGFFYTHYIYDSTWLFHLCDVPQ